MVFENLTLVELNLENARIGPRFGGDDDDDVEAAVEADADDESGGSRFGPLFGFLLLVGLGAALGYRRFRSGDDGGAVDEEGEQITIESAAEQ